MKTEKFKAAVLIGLKKPLEIAQIQLAAPLGYGQVLVKVICSGICGSQIGEIDGVKGEDKFLPHLLGHEGGGIVEEAGPGVAKVKAGDRVVLHWRKGAGIESSTPFYRWNGAKVNAGWVTTFNEYAVVSENRLTVIPEDVDFEIAALMGCAITTGFGVINNDARLKIGESVAIFGAGGVGLSEVQGAQLVSAYPIIAVDLYDHKLDLAKSFGATHLIDASRCNIKEEISKIVGSNGVDVAIDNTGNVSVIEDAYEVASSSGRVILVGVPKAGDKARIYTLPLHFEKSIKGSHGGMCNPSVDIPKYLRLFKKQGLPFKKLITHVFSLEDINSAIETMKDGRAVRCMIRLGE